jgi:isoleucyl-tRNA synthetase
MGDWMISKKRYWGLALPIWECSACGSFDVIGGREELRERAVEGWETFEGHTPHRPYIDAVKVACSACGEPTSRILDVGNPWLDAGIVPFSTLHYREDPDFWARWFPADFITESFPGQFRNWFYSMLAMSTVLRDEAPFRTILGYATLFGEDGRPMHKSWGNAIEFNEAAERMGVDVMRWMYARQRPEENILFGYGAADTARRELLVLWNVYAFFNTYARLAGWTPRAGIDQEIAAAPAWPVLDRWILSRTAGVAERVGDRLADFDAMGAARTASVFIDDLSTWYLRRSRDRMRAAAVAEDRDAAFATMHAALVSLARTVAPILPFLAEAIYQDLMVSVVPGTPESVHLTSWPAESMAPHRDEALERRMATIRRAVELARTLRGQAGLRVRQPLARAWLAVPGGLDELDRELLDLFADEINVKAVEVLDEGSDLLDRRVKPLLPVIGRRLGPKVPAIMAAARAGEFEILADGGARMAGEVLAPDEVEIQAVPRPGTAVAADEGVVVVIDTSLSRELIAEGDARELARAVQDLRKQAQLELDARIALWVDAPREVGDMIAPHLPSVAREVLADELHREAPPAGVPATDVRLSEGTGRIGLRAMAVERTREEAA